MTHPGWQSRRRCVPRSAACARRQNNAQNGISFIQTAEGYLQESQDIMQRLRELSVQASNGIYSDEDRMQIQVEVSALVARSTASPLTPSSTA